MHTSEDKYHKSTTFGRNFYSSLFFFFGYNLDLCKIYITSFLIFLLKI